MIALSGCNTGEPEIVPVTGTLTLNGKPLAHAEISFVPMQEGLSGHYIATAVTDDQGKFTLKIPKGAGACAGENKVTVIEGPLPDEARGQSAKAQILASQFTAKLTNRPIPPQYASLAQSPLSVTVTKDQSDYPIDLKR
ncbi:MAG: hypothetical protein R3B84_01660 [Zavarzinella sp.]